MNDHDKSTNGNSLSAGNEWRRAGAGYGAARVYGDGNRTCRLRRLWLTASLTCGFRPLARIRGAASRGWAFGAVQGMRSHPYIGDWRPGEGNAHVVFDAAELKLPLLGYMVENNVLQQALWQALKRTGVTLRVPASRGITAAAMVMR